ncbi:MAG: metalloregulator ArsR/SmtB family transcription factor [Raoultibacter sp.]
MKANQAAGIFKAVSDENRLRIVRHIARTEDICACKVLDELAITQPTLSHHMKALFASGLVRCRKEGKWMHSSLNYEALDDLKNYVGELLGD